MLNSGTGWAVGDFGTIWQTATERNNAGFYIERSTDDIRYHDIGFAPGTHDRLTDQLGTLKRAGPLTDNHLDLSDLPPGVYCLWLLDGSAETRVARVMKR